MGYNKSIQSKFYNYFKNRLTLKKSTKGFIRGNCPYCGSKFTFGINVRSGKVKCFKDCGIPDSPITLLMYLEGFETKNEGWNFLKIQQEYEAYEGVDRSEKIEKRQVILPESYRLLNSGDSMMGKAARNYMLKRRFNITTLSMEGVGYCTSGQYAGYIIFPFYQRGKLVFFQGRRFAGAGPKMQNPKEEDFGIGKSTIMYNVDALFIYKRIYLSESITNSLTLGSKSTAGLGKSFSSYQISTIIKSPCEEVIILLDPDAVKEAAQLAMALCHYKKVKLVYWQGTQDVNDLGKKKTLELVKQFPWGKYMDFFKLKKQFIPQ